MRNRNVAELLELMVEHQDCFYKGLCIWARQMFHAKLISSSELDILTEYIKANRPSVFSSWDAFKHRKKRFYWTMDDIHPRIEWINQQYNKLTIQQNESN